MFIHTEEIKRIWFVLLFLGFSVAAAVSPLDAKEPPVLKYSIPIDPSTRVEQDYISLYRTFLERNMLAPYKSQKPDESAALKARLEVMERICDMESSRASVADRKTLLSTADGVAQQSADDPFFMGCYGGLLEISGDYAKAETILNTALKAIESNKQVSHTMRFLMRSHLARACFYQGREKQTQAGEAFRAAQSEIAEAIVAGEFQSAEAQIPFRLISELDKDVMGQIDWATLGKRIGMTPKPDPWLKEMLEGCITKEKAWNIRGCYTYNKVPPEKMQAFLNGISEAAPRFKTAHELHPERPEAAVEMISAVRANPNVSEHDAWYWFIQATKAQFDYLTAYRQFTLELLPRWGGSIDQMENFADACLDTRRFDTIVPFLYIRTFRDIANEMKSSGCRGAFRQQHVKSKAIEVLENMEKNPEWSEYDKTCLKTQRMLIASWTGDYTMAKKLLGELPERVDLRFGFRSITLIDDGWYWDQIAAEIAAFTSPHAQSLIEAENAALKGDSDAGAVGFTNVMTQYTTEPPIHDYLRDRAMMTKTGIFNYGDLGLLNNMIYWDHYEPVKFLIENGYPTDGKPTESLTPLRYAIGLKKTGIANLLIERGANLNPSLVLDTPYFEMAASSDQWDLALNLLKKGAPFDPNVSNRHLITVIDKKQSELAVLMIEKGADVNFAGPEGWTPLLYAINSKLTDVAMKLLDKGAKIDAVTPDGWNVLMRCILNDEKLALRVIDMGADVNYKMKDGMMPLHLAVQQRSPGILRKLMSKGADPKIAYMGMTAKQFAEEEKLTEIVQILSGK